jgi:hypothetical protein
MEMTSDDILKITILCETKDGTYLASSTDDKQFIRHAVNVMQFVEIDKKFVGNIDAEKIMKQNTDEKEKNTKLF